MLLTQFSTYRNIIWDYSWWTHVMQIIFDENLLDTADCLLFLMKISKLWAVKMIYQYQDYSLLKYYVFHGFWFFKQNFWNSFILKVTVAARTKSFWILVSKYGLKTLLSWNNL